jgi:hypothetical protein
MCYKLSDSDLSLLVVQFPKVLLRTASMLQTAHDSVTAFSQSVIEEYTASSSINNGEHASVLLPVYQSTLVAIRRGA